MKGEMCIDYILNGNVLTYQRGDYFSEQDIEFIKNEKSIPEKFYLSDLDNIINV